jgi:hypothetical protein
MLSSYSSEPEALATPPGNWAVAVVLGLVVAAFHCLHGIPLAHSVLMQSFNWLFDYDSSRFVEAWCKPGIAGMPGVAEISFAARHALSVPTRALCMAITPFAADPGTALMVLTALCSGCTAAAAYAVAANFCAKEVDRVLLALGFAVSVQPLVMGVIPETFGFAMLGIGVHLALLARHRSEGLGARPVAAFTLFLNLGFTVTNAALNLLSSALMSWRRMTFAQWLAMEMRVWWIGGASVVLLTAAAAAYFDPSLFGMAAKAPQRVWWIININRGEPASLLMVLCTFFLYSFVAPALTVIDLPEPDSHPMLDFRAFEFGALGCVALVLWALALLLSIVLAWRDRGTRRLLWVLAAWMLFNVSLHWYWQYRASIFIYGAHSCFALFTLLAIGYAAALRRYPARWVRGYGVLLLALCAINNYGIYTQMVSFILKQPLAPG